MVMAATVVDNFGILSAGASLPPPPLDGRFGMGGEGDDVLLRFGECVVAVTVDANCCLLDVRSRCRVVKMDVVVVGVTSVGGLSREC